MPLDLSTLIQYLDAVSAVAVIFGVVFVVFQLRQNAKLIEASNKQLETSNRQVEASNQQNRQQVILSTIDRFTDETFIRKRKRAPEIIKKYEAKGWSEFAGSDEDYELGGFLALFETLGFLAKKGIVDVKEIQEGMGFLVIIEWAAMEPAIEHYRKVWKRDDVYMNFKWLHDSVKKVMEKEGIDTSIPPLYATRKDLPNKN